MADTGWPRSSSDEVVTVQGPLDAAAAWKLGEMLGRSAPGARVVLDFSHAGQIHDFGLAVLAVALADHARLRVVLHGLSLHQERMLKYFGVDLASPVARLAERDEVPDADLAPATA